MGKQANTGKIRKKEKKKQTKEKQEKQTMRMTISRRKPIPCWLKTDAEGGIESTSWGDEKRPAADSGRQSGREGDRRCTQNQRGEF